MELNEAIAHARKEAQKLKKKVEGYSDKPYDFNSTVKKNCLECAKEYEQLAEWLTELAERREADRWISVKERLPDEYGNYLVLTSNNDIDIGLYHSNTPDAWSLCDANGFYWEREKGIEITHWRPLPKFYESEEK